MTGLARLPTGINGLAVLLYVHEGHESFGTAGLVVSAMAAGGAIGGPIQGRLVDRYGLTPLFGLAGGWAVTVVFLLVICGGGRPVPLQMLAGFATGSLLPVTTSVLRARWPHLLADRLDLLPQAFALDSLLIEFAFVAGPILVALAVATTGAGMALILSGVVGVAGTLGFAHRLRDRPAPQARPRPVEHRSVFGPLASRSVRGLTLASLPLGFYIGSLDIALPAYAESNGTPAMAGFLVALYSVASATAVMFYGTRQPRRSLWAVHALLSSALVVAALPIIVSSELAAVFAATAIAGLPVAPLISTRNQLIRETAPPGTEAEAFTWPLTALVCGLSLGAGVGGQLIQAGSWRTPILAASAIAAVSLVAFGGLEE